MRYAQIRKLDVSNGPGCRVSLFTQGCNLKCEGCFNKTAWDYNGGKEWTNETKQHLLELCNVPYIAGLSILGGEPLSETNLEDLKSFINEFRIKFPQKTIWMWTGYIYEQLTLKQKEVADMVDVLVDGPWIASLGNFNLKYRGSSNQRIIKIKEQLTN